MRYERHLYYPSLLHFTYNQHQGCSNSADSFWLLFCRIAFNAVSPEFVNQIICDKLHSIHLAVEIKSYDFHSGSQVE